MGGTTIVSLKLGSRTVADARADSIRQATTGSHADRMSARIALFAVAQEDRRPPLAVNPVERLGRSPVGPSLLVVVKDRLALLEEAGDHRFRLSRQVEELETH